MRLKQAQGKIILQNIKNWTPAFTGYFVLICTVYFEDLGGQLKTIFRLHWRYLYITEVWKFEFHQLFWKLVDKTQMSEFQEYTDRFINTLKLFLVGLWGLQSVANQYERPCIREWLHEEGSVSKFDRLLPWYPCMKLLLNGRGLVRDWQWQSSPYSRLLTRSSSCRFDDLLGKVGISRIFLSF